MPAGAPLADVEVRILEKDEHGYPVELTLNMEQEFPRGHVRAAPPPLAEASSSGYPARLFEWLFSDDALKTAWAEIRGRSMHRRIRLRIDAGAPELHALPWELLREPALEGVARDLAAAVDTPFSRYLAGRWRPGNPVLARPLRILVAVSNPRDTDQWGLAAIDAAAEIARVREATAGLAVEIAVLDPPCTLRRIEEALRAGHHVLHFVGHGAFSTREQRSALLLADDSNAGQMVPESDIAGMLSRQMAAGGESSESPLRLVFLMSCQTANRSPGDAFRGLAPSLIRAGVPAVIAMQDLVPFPTAQRFASTFYRQVLQHGHVDLAANEARSSLLTDRLPGVTLPGHAIPCLFMRLREGRLLGARGRVAQEEESFWPFVVGNIEATREAPERILCAPVVGPRAHEGLLPSAADIARRLSVKYHYPLADDDDLARVAQFISLGDPELLRADYLACLLRGLFAHLQRTLTPEEKQRYRKMSLNRVVEDVDWANAILQSQETTLYHQLAALELPLYLTTNADPFLLAALKQRGLAARQEGPRWQAAVGQKEWSLDPAPTSKCPVVFHLLGHAGDPIQQRNLVLSDDDYLRYVVSLSRDYARLMPSQVLKLLAESSLLFVGFDVTDWSFRMLLDGLMETAAGKKRHVGVQLEIDQADDRGQASEYLRRTLARHQIDVYWGGAREFVADLLDHWQNRPAPDSDGGDLF